MNIKRKKRIESFFGLHFDFHAIHGECVGQLYRPDIISKMLDEVKPDYIQCDTKGHPGLSSYPTKIGYQADRINCDVLKMWRDLTAERGIALYGHHSGLFDIQAMKSNPKWAVVDENGIVSDKTASVFGPYCDELLIPQLLELALEYKLDGAWVDGECWATEVDYSYYAQKAYYEKYKKPPAKKGQEDYENYKEFCRQGFRDYVTHYVSKVKETAPEFQITSNWIYSAYMPEKPLVPVDFLSGDYNPYNSVDSARVNARCLANQGKAWDLMAWGHNCKAMWTEKNRTTKEFSQHCQEAAVVISLGGGFQFYNIQYGGGGIVQDWAIPIWKKTAEFCRSREKLCHNAKPFPQIGILYSNLAAQFETTELYSNENSALKSVAGFIHATQDCGLSCEVLAIHNLFDKDISQYKMIIVPNLRQLEQEAIEQLKQYAFKGGNLMLGSPYTAIIFNDIISADIDNNPDKKIIHIQGNNALAAIETLCTSILPINADISGEYFEENYMESKKNAAAILNDYGSGKVCTLSFDFGTVYTANRTTAIRDFYKKQVSVLFPEPKVTIEGSSFADVSIMTKDDLLLINILNYSGPHNAPEIRSFNEIPSIGPLTVYISCDKKPDSIYLEPEHTLCRFDFDGKRLTVKIDKIEIHSVLVVK